MPFQLKVSFKKIEKKIKFGKVKYGKIKMRKDEPKVLFPVTKKIKKYYNWYPKIKLDLGLKKTIKFYEKKFPLVSIIVNCFNGEKFLSQSIKTIFDQTYTNWEIIFWDNKSSDKSREIIKSFKDRRIKYFYSKKYNTLYKSRNLAIKKTKGDYICFLDTDDLWSKKKLKIN